VAAIIVVGGVNSLDISIKIICGPSGSTIYKKNDKKTHNFVDRIVAS